MHLILNLIFFFIFSEFAHAKVVPVQVRSSQAKEISKKFSGLFSLQTSNSPTALGEDFEIEASAIYQNLKQNKVEPLENATSSELLEPILTFRKGLYWNIDMAFSFALPVNSHVVSGYSFNLNRASKWKGLLLKPELFITSYTLNDLLTLKSTGLTLIAFKEIRAFYWGLGGRIEFADSIYEKRFAGKNTLIEGSKNEFSFTTSSAMMKLGYKYYSSRISLTYSYSGNHQNDFMISLSTRI